MRMTPLLAAILAAPLAVTPALAQDSSSQSDSSSSGSQSDQSSQSGQSQSGGDTSGQQQEDSRVVTVGDTDIMSSEVLAAVQALPPQMQQQPAEQLVPMAVEQLVLRELILQEAESQNLQEDPEVQELASGDQSMENAIVQVYVQRELEGAVTDEAVQQTYDEVQQNAQEEVPPLDQVRPQIEQQLRAQRLNEVRNDLLSGDTEIVYYGPDGEPRENPAGTMDPMGGGSSSDSGSGSGQSGSGSNGGSGSGN